MARLAYPYVDFVPDDPIRVSKLFSVMSYTYVDSVLVVRIAKMPLAMATGQVGINK